jgi:TonB-dependent SusC/RagA subfamily outer membrane receptor
MNATSRGALLALTASLVAFPLRAQQDTTAVPAPGYSVGVIAADSIARTALVTTFSDLMTARLAGVEVLSSSGTIGAASRILIRGAGGLLGTPAPVVYVDGMRVDAEASALTIPIGGQQVSRLDDLDPRDIDSVVVLRGPAAAALYGSEAAGGVLLVTTKRDAPGPLRLHAYTTQGMSHDPHLFPVNFATGPSGVLTNDPLGDPAKSPFRTGYLRGYGADAAAGDARGGFYAAARWDGTGGVYGLPSAERARLENAGGLHPEVLNPSNLGRLSLRGNGRLRLSERADLSVSTAYVSSDLRLPQNGNSTVGVLANGLLGSGDSTLNGGWRSFPPGTLFQLATSEALHRFTGSARAEVHVFSFLGLHALAGLEHVSQTDLEVQRNGEGPAFGQRTGNVTDSRVAWRRWSLRGSAVGAFAPSRALILRSTLGVEYFKDKNHWLARSGTQLPPGSTSIDDASLYATAEVRSSGHTLGFFVEQRALVRDRLSLGAAARWDRVTRDFAASLTQFYPRVDAAWILPVARAPTLDRLRLRAAYGRAGVIAPPVPVVFVQIGTPLPSFVKPEPAREVEIGTDAGMFGGRVTLGATYYHKSVRPLVVVPQVWPGVIVFGTELAGRLTNTGVELTLGAALVRTPLLTWQATATAWGNRNRLNGAPLNVVPFSASTFTLQRHDNGVPAGSYVTLPIMGYQDLDRDGRIAPSEVAIGSTPVFAGTPFPTQGGSLGTTVTLGGRLRASALAEYRGGNRLLNSTEWFRCAQRVCRAAVDPTAPLADQAKAAVGLATPSGFIEDAAFVKLREVSLTYAAPAAWAGRVGAQGASLTLAARNLATWTHYSGVDPEVSAQGPESFGVEDFFTQPPVRSVVVRLDVSF